MLVGEAVRRRQIEQHLESLRTAEARKTTETIDHHSRHSNQLARESGGRAVVPARMVDRGATLRCTEAATATEGRGGGYQFFGLELPVLPPRGGETLQRLMHEGCSSRPHLAIGRFARGSAAALQEYCRSEEQKVTLRPCERELTLRVKNVFQQLHLRSMEEVKGFSVTGLYLYLGHI